MKARELAAALLALPPEQQELEVMALEEVWAYEVDRPRLAFIDDEGREANAGEAVIALWETGAPPND